MIFLQRLTYQLNACQSLFDNNLNDNHNKTTSFLLTVILFRTLTISHTTKEEDRTHTVISEPLLRETQPEQTEICSETRSNR